MVLVGCSSAQKGEREEKQDKRETWDKLVHPAPVASLLFVKNHQQMITSATQLLPDESTKRKKRNRMKVRENEKRERDESDESDEIERGGEWSTRRQR